jgi:long-chain acyl-CoA synthetase
MLTVIYADEWLEKPGSVGRPLPPFEVVVVDDADQPVPPGTPGRLFFRDPSGRGIEYYNDPEKSAEAHLAPGVFTLGEVGFVDSDGFVFLTDRVSDMVVSGGVNVYPAECERVLLAHPAVADAALYGVPDAEMGERLVGLVVLRDETVEPDTLISYCRSRLAHYKVPRELRVIDGLPRSAMGKLDKRKLRDDALRSRPESN